jgi:hypothetical protein
LYYESAAPQMPGTSHDAPPEATAAANAQGAASSHK